jgi:hypothetical protein
MLLKNYFEGAVTRFLFKESRFHTPLIQPVGQISRIRLSDKTSRLHFRVQRHLQFLNTHRS